MVEGTIPMGTITTVNATENLLRVEKKTDHMKMIKDKKRRKIQEKLQVLNLDL